MFIRWIERPPKIPGRYETALSLILADTKRVDGTVRQRHIAYLGGITDRGIENLIHCCSFWDSVTAAFDELGDTVPPADRERFETDIADRVPRPSADAYKDAARQTAQRYGWESLSTGFKAVLADEAEQWKAHETRVRAEDAEMVISIMHGRR
jgi:hypothetical protein